MRNPSTPHRVRRLVWASALSLGLGGVCAALAGGNARPASASTGPIIGVTIPLLPTVSTSSAGQVIPLAFVVTNTGDSEGSGVSVSLFDPVSGDTTAATCLATTLAAGAHTTCSATYTVTNADLLGVDPIRLDVQVGSGGSSFGGVTVSGPTTTTPFTIPVVDGPDVVITPTTTPTKTGPTKTGPTKTGPSTAGPTTPVRTVEAPVTTTTVRTDATTGSSSKNPPLAFTGFDVLPLLVTGGALVGGGGALAAFAEARRRQLSRLDQ